MDEPTVLRETKIGQKGFIKEDVMQYLDELNSKIINLETELEKAQSSGPADPQEIVKYRNQVDSLQEKLNTSNNALRAAKQELEAAKKQHEQDQKLIAQLKASGGAAPAAPAQGGANPAELAAAKSEIDKLKNQLKEAEQKLANAPKAAPAAPAQPAADPAKDAELAKVKGDLAKVNGDLQAKTREIADKDAKIAQLTKDVEDKTAAAAKKDEEIAKLNSEITDLKENAEAGGVIPASFDMGALFTEAQKTANKITIEAKHAADKMTKDANEEAEKIVNDANIEAAKTIANANMTAEACIKEANEKAKLTVVEANVHADKVNEMSKTVRDLLRNEIESVNTKFADITSVLNRLTSQASDRMSEAVLVIGEARKAVGDDGDVVKRAEAPAAQFEAKKVSAAYEKKSEPVQEKTVFNSTPAAQPAPVQPKVENKPSKKAASFNFDMAELLKAAEEEAAKGTE